MRGLKWLLAAALVAATFTFAGSTARADEAAESDPIASLKAKDELLTARLKAIAKNTDNASAFHCWRRGYCGWGGCGWGWGCYRPCYNYCYTPVCYTPVCYTPVCYTPAVAYRPAYYPTVSYYAPTSFVSYGGYGGCFYW